MCLYNNFDCFEVFNATRYNSVHHHYIHVNSNIIRPSIISYVFGLVGKNCEFCTT